jgi:hypothetical protein
MKPLWMIVPLIVCGGVGVALGYFLGDVGMRDEYMRNYGAAGGMAGLVIGAILTRRMSKG